MAISPWCAEACWHINRLKQHLIGAVLLTPELAVTSLRQSLVAESAHEPSTRILEILQKHLPGPRVYASNGALILNPYTDEELAAKALEERFDFDFLVKNQRFYSTVLFILQTCAACEAFLKDKLNWALSVRPVLLKAMQNELHITLNHVLSAKDLDEVFQELRDQVVAQVIKGELWKEKVRRFCKVLGVEVPKDTTVAQVNDLFSLRNRLLHTKEPSELDLGFMVEHLVLKSTSQLSDYYRALEALLQFADAAKEHLYWLDQEVLRTHRT